eukprot:Nk52_evm8s2355 gene=Nk52_evmTU8s2355
MGKTGTSFALLFGFGYFLLLLIGTVGISEAAVGVTSPLFFTGPSIPSAGVIWGDHIQYSFGVGTASSSATEDVTLTIRHSTAQSGVHYVLYSTRNSTTLLNGAGALGFTVQLANGDYTLTLEGAISGATQSITVSVSVHHQTLPVGLLWDAGSGGGVMDIVPVTGRIAAELFNEDTSLLPHSNVLVHSKDTGCVKQRGLFAILDLVQAPTNKIEAVVGPQCSPEAISVAPMCELFKLPMSSYFAASESLSNKLLYPYFTRTVFATEPAGIVSVSLHFGWTRINTLTYDAHTWGSNYYNLLKASGIRIQEEVQVKDGLIDYTLDLQRIKDSGVRVIHSRINSGSAHLLYRQAVDLGIAGPGWTWVLSGVTYSGVLRVMNQTYNATHNVMDFYIGSLWSFASYDSSYYELWNPFVDRWNSKDLATYASDIPGIANLKTDFKRDTITTSLPLLVAANTLHSFHSILRAAQSLLYTKRLPFSGEGLLAEMYQTSYNSIGGNISIDVNGDYNPTLKIIQLRKKQVTSSIPAALSDYYTFGFISSNVYQGSNTSLPHGIYFVNESSYKNIDHMQWTGMQWNYHFHTNTPPASFCPNGCGIGKCVAPGVCECPPEGCHEGSCSSKISKRKGGLIIFDDFEVSRSVSSAGTYYTLFFLGVLGGCVLFSFYYIFRTGSKISPAGVSNIDAADSKDANENNLEKKRKTALTLHIMFSAENLKARATEGLLETYHLSYQARDLEEKIPGSIDNIFPVFELITDVVQIGYILLSPNLPFLASESGVVKYLSLLDIPYSIYFWFITIFIAIWASYVLLYLTGWESSASKSMLGRMYLFPSKYVLPLGTVLLMIPTMVVFTSSVECIRYSSKFRAHDSLVLLQQCSIECWSPLHWVFVVISTFMLPIFIICSLIMLPLWQMLHRKTLKITFKRRVLCIDMLFKFLLVILRVYVRAYIWWFYTFALVIIILYISLYTFGFPSKVSWFNPLKLSVYVYLLCVAIVCVVSVDHSNEDSLWPPLLMLFIFIALFGSYFIWDRAQFPQKFVYEADTTREEIRLFLKKYSDNQSEVGSLIEEDIDNKNENALGVEFDKEKKRNKSTVSLEMGGLPFEVDAEEVRDSEQMEAIWKEWTSTIDRWHSKRYLTEKEFAFVNFLLVSESYVLVQLLPSIHEKEGIEALKVLACMCRDMRRFSSLIRSGNISRASSSGMLGERPSTLQALCESDTDIENADMEPDVIANSNDAIVQPPPPL